MPPKTTTPHKATAKKPRAIKPKKEHIAAHKPATAEAKTHDNAPKPEKILEKAPEKIKDGKYIFATGRRKTAVANVRLFNGSGETVINKKPLNKYFANIFFQEEISKPFSLTGLAKDYYFIAHINGGGSHSQAQALQHGLAVALSKTSEEVRKILKKNGLLTRDDRKKERKKPGLKRARRSPQWAKR